MAIGIAIDLFFTYAPSDVALRDEFAKHLANLQRQGAIRQWSDQQIVAGSDRLQEIQTRLDSANLILLLLSADFIAVDECEAITSRAMIRHAKGTTTVIPILLRPVDYQGAPYSHLAPLPDNGESVTLWSNQDAAFLNIVQGIRQFIENEGRRQEAEGRRQEAEERQRARGKGQKVEAISDSPIPLFTHLPSPTPNTRHSTPQTWIDRPHLTQTLLPIFQSDRRIITLVGITGIGKTTLANHLTSLTPYPPIHPSTHPPHPLRLDLNDRSLLSDFSSSGAELLRKLGDEPTLDDQKDPRNLVAHLLQKLRSHPYRVQLDSMELLLKGDEQEGWSEFVDPLWCNLWQQLLMGDECLSQVILTTQDVPEELEAIGSRYWQFWHCERIGGMTETEQLQLFQQYGIALTPETEPYLKRIGRLYEGHPLVLRVIAEDLKDCRGNVARYWQQFGFEQMESRSTRLARRRFQRDVEQRVRASLAHLPPNALDLLCRSAVYRRPVPESFWLAMLPDLTEPQQQATLDLLKSRNLAEEDWAPDSWLGTDNSIPLRQHPLIRSVAYELLKQDTPTWQTSERKAAELWLNEYHPALNVPNLEKVRGYLEAFDHYCEMEDWQQAKDVLLTPLETPTKDQIYWQLGIWGLYRQQIQCCKCILGKLDKQMDSSWLTTLGVAYSSQGNYEQAIEYYKQSLTLAIKNCDKQGEGAVLGNLGSVYYSLGKYEQAIDYYQQHLAIAREIGDRWGEGTALGNLGNAYYRQGDYEQSIKYHEQSLTITCKIGDRQGEGNALGNLGSVYYSLGKYEQAIDYYQQHLAIAREIGDRWGEGTALGNLGEAQFNLKQYTRAMENSQAALRIFQEIGSRAGEATVLKNLAELHQKLGEIESARQECDLALAIATELGIPLVEECKKLQEELQGAKEIGNDD